MTNEQSGEHEYDGEDLVPGSDGLPVREVGSWSQDKHHFLERYIDIFTASMSRRPWEGLGYIDLFAGPGRCKIRGTDKEIDGSPLLALAARDPFDFFVFADTSSDSIRALKQRFRNRRAHVDPLTYEANCNTAIGRIAEELPRGYLYLGFLDPTNLDIYFSTIRTLAANRPVDLILSFMDRLDLNRNIEKTYYRSSDSKADRFFGEGSNWREKFSLIANWDGEHITKLSLEVYRDQLRKIGYKHFGQPVRILGKAGASQTPFYLLFFASKHPRGAEFWDKISKKDRQGQRSLPYD